jgi:hypothetical protein
MSIFAFLPETFRATLQNPPNGRKAISWAIRGLPASSLRSDNQTMA